jgi:hypothetical protein
MSENNRAWVSDSLQDSICLRFGIFPELPVHARDDKVERRQYLIGIIE